MTGVGNYGAVYEGYFGTCIASFLRSRKKFISREKLPKKHRPGIRHQPIFRVLPAQVNIRPDTSRTSTGYGISVDFAYHCGGRFAPNLSSAKNLLNHVDATFQRNRPTDFNIFCFESCRPRLTFRSQNHPYLVIYVGIMDGSLHYLLSLLMASDVQ